jgi:translation elongation factor EF-1beta
MDALLEEAHMNGHKYANYQSIFVGNCIYDSTACGSKAPLCIPSTMCTKGRSKAGSSGCSLVEQIAATRHMVESALAGGHSESSHHVHFAAGTVSDLRKEMDELRAENAKLNEMMSTVLAKLAALETRVSPTQAKKEAPAPATTKAPVAAKKGSDEDEDIDLFGSDDEDDEEKDKLKQERLDAYNAKKAKKPALIAKSSVILDVKPWDDETDMAAMEKAVRSIEKDGLVWGASKLLPVGYGIKKLQIICVVEDDKVSVEELTEQISENFEEHVQSVDIAAFNKI